MTDFGLNSVKKYIWILPIPHTWCILHSYWVSCISDPRETELKLLFLLSRSWQVDVSKSEVSAHTKAVYKYLINNK